MIQVNKPYLPDIKKYNSYCEKIWKSNYLTNFGPLSIELENRLCEYLKIPHILLVGNGTLALQIAYKTIGLKAGDNVLTTAFSFVATSNTLLWEGLNPIFCDIDSKSFCIDTAIAERLCSNDIKAILPVHVFGNPCEVEILESIAKRHNCKLIYDAAHAFNVYYKDTNVLNFGDISTLSFHATKLFHTIEGGAIISKSADYIAHAKEIINFGLKDNMPHYLGINAKLNEFNAAMGLCVLDSMPFIMEDRCRVWSYYHERLSKYFDMQEIHRDATNNYHYFPILFKNESLLLDAIRALNENNIFPRRYFYPSLHNLPFFSTDANCEKSIDISSRILCLPIYVGLERANQDRVVDVVVRFA